MFFVVYLAAECGALKRTCAEVEGKRYQRIELPLRERHANQAQRVLRPLHPDEAGSRASSSSTPSRNCSLLASVIDNHSRWWDTRLDTCK